MNKMEWQMKNGGGNVGNIGWKKSCYSYFERYYRIKIKDTPVEENGKMTFSSIW